MLAVFCAKDKAVSSLMEYAWEKLDAPLVRGVTISTATLEELGSVSLFSMFDDDCRTGSAEFSHIVRVAVDAKNLSGALVDFFDSPAGVECINNTDESTAFVVHNVSTSYARKVEKALPDSPNVFYKYCDDKAYPKLFASLLNRSGVESSYARSIVKSVDRKNLALLCPLVRMELDNGGVSTMLETMSATECVKTMLPHFPKSAPPPWEWTTAVKHKDFREFSLSLMSFAGHYSEFYTIRKIRDDLEKIAISRGDKIGYTRVGATSVVSAYCVASDFFARVERSERSCTKDFFTEFVVSFFGALHE